MKGSCSSWPAAGWTYCALGALSLLGKPLETSGAIYSASAWPSEHSVDQVLGWLVSRQTTVLQEDDDRSLSENTFQNLRVAEEEHHLVGLEVEIPSYVPPQYFLPDEPSIELSDSDLEFAGMAGRCNKIADSCYTFWAGGSLAMLNSLHLIDQDALCQYLYTKTQHPVLGGFGKIPGDMPGRLLL
ncbi:MAG: hypothetical protein Q9170_000083 [Blastenia crenularia]